MGIVSMTDAPAGPNKERIKLWLDALVSGDYGQGTGLLKNPDGNYCCLGVAAEVCAANGGPKMGSLDTGFPDKEVNDWFGDWLAGGFNLGEDADGEDMYVTPVSLNDGDKKSFRYIAAALAVKYGIDGFPFPKEDTDAAE